jgi:hypothetical protein
MYTTQCADDTLKMMIAVMFRTFFVRSVTGAFPAPSRLLVTRAMSSTTHAPQAKKLKLDQTKVLTA